MKKEDIVFLGIDDRLPPIKVARWKYLDFTMNRAREMKQFHKRLLKRWTKKK